MRRQWMSFVVVLMLSLMTLAATGVPAVEAQIDADASAMSSVDDPLEYPKWQTVAPGENMDYNQRQSLIQRGRQVYGKYCIGCHGEYGDGKGPASKRLLTQPRDFTKGIYKFRSTDSSSLPMETDLHGTITGGLAQVSMPAFPLMPESDKLAVIEYVKTFYINWDRDKDNRRIVPIPQAPTDLDSDERVRRGRAIYLATQCWKCHGVDGRGTGATQTEYTDAWGNPQKAFDFTRGELKGGNQPEDVYRTFHTGLRSIMPSFGGDTLGRVSAQAFFTIADVVEPQEWENLQPIIQSLPADGAAVMEMSPSQLSEAAESYSWDLVAYVLSLRPEKRTTAEAVLGSSAGGR